MLRMSRKTMTNAERQAEYRRRRRDGEVGEKQINAWISEKAKWTFARIAAHHGMTEKDLLEKLILDEEARICAKLLAGGKNEHF